MILRDISQCSSKFNFHPLAPWPESLPAICWKEFLIAGFQHQGLAVDQKNYPLVDVFTSIYPQLSLSELARLYTLWEEQKKVNEWHLFWPKVCGYYGLRDKDHLRKLLSKLAQTPKSFQDWVSNKKISPGDLAILHSFEKLDSLNLFMEQIAVRSISRQRGLQILELLGELLLLGEESMHRLTATREESPESWESRLRGLRYPKTLCSDTSRSQSLSELPWPKFVKTRWVRRGDQAGVELRLEILSGRDLRQKLQSLEPLGTHIDNWADEPCP